MRLWWFYAAVFTLIWGLPGCDKGRAPSSQAETGSSELLPPPVSETWHVMGTFAAVRVPAGAKGRLKGWADVTRRTFEEINGKLSTYIAGSEISRLNAAAGKKPVPLSKTTLQALRMAARYQKDTDGAFEPTLAPLIRLWGFSGGDPPLRLLTEKRVREALQAIGMGHVKLEENGAVLEIPGMALDLGGIGKGFAVDRAFEALLKAGAKNYLIDLGGNMRCQGGSRGQGFWGVGVRNPFQRDQLVGVLRLTDGQAVATSGNYEQFVTIDGARYAHIIDPRTGFPSKGVAGVTVVSQTATEADALSTALFVLGPTGAASVLRRFPGSHAIFVPDRRPLEILVTPGLESLFEPFKESAPVVKVLRP